MKSSWITDILNVITESAAGHPFLIGSLLIVILLSTALHVLIFTAHLFLGLSKYFRRQTAEIQDLTYLYREEWQYWRQIFDVARVRSMSSAQIHAELKRNDIDAEKTTEVITSLVETLLLRLRASQNESPKSEHAAPDRD